jgi:hypothetical protein
MAYTVRRRRPPPAALTIVSRRPETFDLSQFAAGEEDGCIAIQIDGQDAGEVCETER